jgi:hypothetical protein|nr:MAG TPA: hypothetical protein [Caudoviricetes sp.]
MKIEKLSPASVLISDAGSDVVFERDGHPYLVAPDITIESGGVKFRIPAKAIDLEMVSCTGEDGGLAFTAVDGYNVRVEHRVDGNVAKFTSKVEKEPKQIEESVDEPATLPAE